MVQKRTLYFRIFSSCISVCVLQLLLLLPCSWSPHFDSNQTFVAFCTICPEWHPRAAPLPSDWSTGNLSIEFIGLFGFGHAQYGPMSASVGGVCFSPLCRVGWAWKPSVLFGAAYLEVHCVWFSKVKGLHRHLLDRGHLPFAMTETIKGELWNVLGYFFFN